jgi:hypothetical protein
VIRSVRHCSEIISVATFKSQKRVKQPMRPSGLLGVSEANPNPCRLIKKTINHRRHLRNSGAVAPEGTNWIAASRKLLAMTKNLPVGSVSIWTETVLIKSCFDKEWI